MPEEFAVKVSAISIKMEPNESTFSEATKISSAKKIQWKLCGGLLLFFIFVFCRQASGLFNQRPSDL